MTLKSFSAKLFDVNIVDRSQTEHFLTTNEPADEIMALFVLRKLILQTSMRSHPVGLGV